MPEQSLQQDPLGNACTDDATSHSAIENDESDNSSSGTVNCERATSCTCQPQDSGAQALVQEPSIVKMTLPKCNYIAVHRVQKGYCRIKHRVTGKYLCHHGDSLELQSLKDGDNSFRFVSMTCMGTISEQKHQGVIVHLLRRTVSDEFCVSIAEGQPTFQPIPEKLLRRMATADVIDSDAYIGLIFVERIDNGFHVLYYLNNVTEHYLSYDGNSFMEIDHPGDVRNIRAEARFEVDPDRDGFD